MYEKYSKYDNMSLVDFGVSAITCTTGKICSGTKAVKMDML